MAKYILTLILVISFPSRLYSADEIHFDKFADIYLALRGIDKEPSILQTALGEAENGKVFAKTFLGILYQSGTKAIEANQQKAFYWLSQAADSNEPLAVESIAFYYKNGEDGIVEKDVQKAVDFFKKAYDLAIDSSPLIAPNSKNISDVLLRESSEKLAQIYDDADNLPALREGYVNRGNPSQEELDIRYADAALDSWNFSNAYTAATLICHLKESGSPEATRLEQRFVDSPPLSGKKRSLRYKGDVERLPQQAAEAVKKREVEEARGAGKALLRKNGETHNSSFGDLKEAEKQVRDGAMRWLKTSVERGSPWSQNRLALRLESGDGTPKDPEKALALFTEAAESGAAYAQFNLGTRYYNGSGVAKDLDKAEEWLTKAKEGGNKEADHFLALIEQERVRTTRKNIPHSGRSAGRFTVYEFFHNPSRAGRVGEGDRITLAGVVTTPLNLNMKPDAPGHRKIGFILTDIYGSSMVDVAIEYNPDSIDGKATDNIPTQYFEALGRDEALFAEVECTVSVGSHGFTQFSDFKLVGTTTQGF